MASKQLEASDSTTSSTVSADTSCVRDSLPGRCVGNDDIMTSFSMSTRHARRVRLGCSRLRLSSSSVYLLVIATVLFSKTSTVGASKGVYGGDYCDTEVFRAECSDGEVIIMQKALYGRLKIGRCVEIDLGYIGCYTDVLTAADRRCSGKRVCEIRVPDAEFESTRPCLKELKTYLEASYQCVPGIYHCGDLHVKRANLFCCLHTGDDTMNEHIETVTTDYCKAHDQLNVSATSTSGYIASVVTSDTPYCDGSSHPWVISGLPGQTINLTLYDFAVDTGNMLVVTGGSGSRPQYSTSGGAGARRQGQHQQQVSHLSVATIDSPGAAPAASTVTGVSSADASAAASPATCIQYGLVEDGGGLRSSGGQPSPAGSVGTRGNLVSAERPTAICSNGRDRVRHVYRSTGHVVRVWVTGGAAPTDLKRFVIHYSVTGCPDFDVPAHAWFTRTEDGNGRMGCKYSPETSIFRCVDNVWSGTFINCSEFRLTVIDKQSDNVDEPLLSYGKHSDTAVSMSAGREWFSSKVMTVAILIGVLAGAVCLVVVIVAVALRRRRYQQGDHSGRQSVLLRKRQTEADTKMAAAVTGNGGVGCTGEYYYDTTGYSKRPIMTNCGGIDPNGCSPATEPLIAADRRMQQQQRQRQLQQHGGMMTSSDTNGLTGDHQIVTVRTTCGWPDDRNGSNGNISMTSCSTFKMAPMTPEIQNQTNCHTMSTGYRQADGHYAVQQTNLALMNC